MAIYIDDIYVKFYNTIRSASGFPSRVTPQAEYNAMDSFYKLLIDDDPVTERQSIYILRLLHKYSLLSKSCGYDFDELLKNAIWKYPFRIIDETRKVYVTQEDEEIRINLKFPYSFKNLFETKFAGSRKFTPYLTEYWNKDTKVQYLSPYSVNLFDLEIFLKSNEFEIDDSFEALVSLYEEIHDQEDNITPRCSIENGEVILKNCCEDSQRYFDEHKCNDIDSDLMLAKSMSIRLEPHSSYTSPIAEICKNKSTMFCTDVDKISEIIKKTKNNVCVLVSDDGDTYEWTKEFVTRALENNVQDIRVCFRSKDKTNSNFNDWVKDIGVGGEVSSGKVFIFKGKPAKWLFTNDIKTDIICTNGVNLIANRTTQTLIRQHPCVIHLSNNATPYKEGKIVEL